MKIKGTYSNFINSIWSYTNKYKMLFMVSFVAFFVVHMYFCTNFVTNHDDIGERYHLGYNQTASGRWLLPVINKITFFTLNSSWTIGILTAVILSLGIVVLIDVFEIKGKFSLFMISCVLISYPIVSSWLLYAWMAVGFVFGLAMSIIAIKLIKIGFYLPLNQIIGHIAIISGASLSICLSLGCYQAFVCIYIATVWWLLMKQSLMEKYSNKQYVKNLIYCMLPFLLGYFIYNVILNYRLASGGMSLTSYQGISESLNITISSFIQGIQLAYSKFFLYYLTNEFFVFKIIKYINLAMLIFVTFQIGKEILFSKTIFVRKIWAFLLFVLAPIFINSIYLLTQGRAFVYSCMEFAYVVPYLVAIYYIDKMEINVLKEFKVIHLISVLLAGILVCCNFMLCNRAYANQAYNMTITTQFYNRLAMRLESVDGLTPETKVYFANPIIKGAKPEIEVLLDTADKNGYLVSSGGAIHVFLRDYCALNINLLYDDDEIKKINECDEYKQMGEYPANSSMRFINDVLVIKFQSDVE